MVPSTREKRNSLFFKKVRKFVIRRGTTTKRPTASAKATKMDITPSDFFIFSPDDISADLVRAFIPK